jgi:hypothetical protein
MFRNFRIFLTKASLLTFLPNRSRTKRVDLLSFFRSLLPVQTEIDLVRIGGRNDGGYLVPNILEGIQGLISPGVGKSISFDTDFARNIPGLLIDGTVDRPINMPTNLDFLPKLLGGVEGISLKQILDGYFPGMDNLIMQMDIEGSEWEVLTEANEIDLSRFRIIIIELHKLHLLSNRERFNHSFNPATNKLLKLFTVVHLHCNNGGGFFYFQGIKLPRIIELTLLSKDFHMKNYGLSMLPHKLDEPNLPEIPELYLPKML